jgi:hypothetical protein
MTNGLQSQVMGKLKNYSTPNPNPNFIMHLPYSPNPTPPPTTTRPALHSKWTTTKPSYPQAHKNTAGSKKIAWCQHSKQTLWRLFKRDNLFLDNSITQAKGKRTTIAKNDTNNARHVAISFAHAQHDHPTIELTQHGCNMAYRLGSTINQTINKLNRNKHVSFSKQNKVHLFDATSTPSIMLTYNSGADRHYISKHD